MATTSRVIVVLRSALGRQLSIKNKELKIASEAHLKSLGNLEKEKEFKRVRGSYERLERAIEHLGGLQLGDLEDEDLFKN